MSEALRSATSLAPTLPPIDSDTYHFDRTGPGGSRFESVLASLAPPQVRDQNPADAGVTHDASARPSDCNHVQTVAETGPRPGSTSTLGAAWDWTRHQAQSASHAMGTFDDAHGHVLTRAAGVAQAVGGAAEAVAGAATAGVGGAATATGVGAAPGIPAMIGGGALATNGADNAIAGLRTAVTGDFHHTLTSQAAGAAAHALGASDRTADRVTNGVDLAQGIAGGGASIAAGIVKRGAGTVVEHAGQVAGDAGKVAPELGSKTGAVAKAAEGEKVATAEARVASPPLKATDAVSDALRRGQKLSNGHPPVELDHVFEGEISPARGVDKAKGFHHAPGDSLHPGARVIQETVPRNAAGLYKARIEVTDPASGIKLTKSSTMFPDTMSRDEVVASLQHAYANATQRTGNSFVGPSGHGFFVEGFTVGSGPDLHIRTGYPKLSP